MELAVSQLRPDQGGMVEAPLPDLDKSGQEPPPAVIDSVTEKPKAQDWSEDTSSTFKDFRPSCWPRGGSTETEIQPGAVAMIGFSGSGKTVFASLFTNFMYEAAEHLGMKIVLQDGFKTRGP